MNNAKRDINRSFLGPNTFLHHVLNNLQSTILNVIVKYCDVHAAE
jgi:hypothetical protein